MQHVLQGLEERLYVQVELLWYLLPQQMLLLAEEPLFELVVEHHVSLE